MNCIIEDFWSVEALACGSILIITACAWLQNIFNLDTGYGRFISQKRSSLLVSASVSWMIYESPNLIISIYFLLFKDFPYKIANIVLISLFIIHYIHRAIIYPLKIRGNARKYPLEIASLATMFCTLNGFYQTYSLSYLCKYDDEWVYDWRFSIGISIFFIGMFINIKSDNILLGLKRKKLEQLSKEDKNINIERNIKIYSIPNEFLFKYITAPNYFGELLEWIGFAIAGWSMNGIVFAITSLNNLLPRALLNHQWYRNNFSEYPKNRKAMIPFVL